MTAKYRAGMVGAGNICEFHVAAVKKLAPDVELVGVMRPRPGARARERREVGHDRVQGPRRARRGGRERDPRADAAVVAREGRDRGAREGLPRADREADRRGRSRGARDRRARARRRGSSRRVNHSLLYDPQVKRALDAARAGALGQVVSVDILRGSEYPPYEGGPLPPWYRDAGYPFRDIGVHCLYLVQELLGPIEDVDADWRSLGGDPNLAFDEWRAMVRCKRGLGQFQLTWNTRPMQSQMIIHGTKGVLRVDLFAMFHGKRASTPLPKAAERLVNAFADSIQPLIDVPIGVWKFVRKEVQSYQGLRDLVADFYARLAAGRAAAGVGRRRRGGRDVGREGRARGGRGPRWRGCKRFERSASVPFLVTGASGSVGQRGREAAARRRPPRARVRAADPGAGGGRRRVRVRQPRRSGGGRSRPSTGAETVIHAGAAMKGGWPEHSGGTVVGTQNVIDACKKHGVKQLVHISSMSVIDWAGSAGNGPVSEAAQPRAARRRARRVHAREARGGAARRRRRSSTACRRDPAARADLRRRHPADQRRGRAQRRRPVARARRWQARAAAGLHRRRRRRDHGGGRTRSSSAARSSRSSIPST